MRPMFSIHAGEFLVGDYVERHYPSLRVWVPSRDTGVDLLVTDRTHRQTLALQVKSSRDFAPTHHKPEHRPLLTGCGWWNFNTAKLVNAKADKWVLALIGLDHRRLDCVVVSPLELLARLEAIHGPSATLRSYIWVTKAGRCFETRGLGKAAMDALVAGDFEDEDRDFTAWLNDWSCLDELNI